MQTQPQPQQASSQATQAMLQQSKAPQQEQQQNQQPEQEGQGDGGQDNFDSQILENLEQHLNQLNPKQQNFLASSLQHYANIVIPFVGIVCGQEVMDYFTNIYKQHFAKGVGNNTQQSSPMQAQQNSAPSPQAGPNQAAQPMPQQAQQQPPAQQSPQQ